MRPHKPQFPVHMLLLLRAFQTCFFDNPAPEAMAIEPFYTRGSASPSRLLAPSLDLSPRTNP